MRRFPPPLRYTIPALIVVFGSLAGVTSFFQEIRESYRAAEQGATLNLRTTTAQTSRIIEYLHRSSDSESQVKTLVSQLGSYRDFHSVIILNDRNIVTESNDYRQNGTLVKQTSASGYLSKIAEARQSLQGSVFISQNRRRLIAIYPVLLGSLRDEIKPSRVGILFVEYNLEDVKKSAFQLALRRALISNLYLIVFCLSIWLFFQFTLTKRIRKLVETSQRLGDGVLDARSVLAGSDELAEVSVALDSMAEKMQQNSIRLERQARKEQLLREINDRIRRSLDLDKIFEVAAREIRGYLNADRALIYQFTPGSGCRRGKFISESLRGSVQSLLMQEVEDHCFSFRQVERYLAGRCQVIGDVSEATLAPCYRQILDRFQIRANAVVPLVSGQQLWGLLCVHQCDRPRAWISDELEFMNYVSAQLGIAIQQSSLFSQVEAELKEKKQAEERLVRTNQQLADANDQLSRATRLKDEFLANMSHELRTPLNGILGMAESLRENLYGEITPPQHTAIEEISKSGSHLLDLINDILDITKIESGKLEIHRKPVSVVSLCEICLETAKHLAAPKSLTLESYLQADIPVCLLDPKIVRQVLINLLSNAIKFTPGGGRIGLLAATQSPAPGSSEDHLLILQVSDTGIGIKQDDRERVFLPFVQVDSSLNRQFGGTGLGLSIVRKLLEAHGGAIQLESEEGKGSRFTVTLPLLPVSDEDLSIPSVAADGLTAIPAAAKQAAALQPNGIRILLAEDNRVNSMIYLRYLRAKGYAVSHASNGQEALELARAEHPDVLLLDMSMPILDGFEVLRALRAHQEGRPRPPIRIISLTALAMKGDRERCLASGADAYLTKPVKLNQLDLTIKQMLAQGVVR